MVRILLRNATILYGKELKILPKGFIYLEDASVKKIGKDEPPEEYELAELYLSANNRLVMSGTISPATYVSFYPFRYLLLKGLVNPFEILSVLSVDDYYYISLMAGYELVKNGVTTIGVLDQENMHAIIRGLFEIGLRLILLVDPYVNDIDKLINEWEGKENRVHVYALVESSIDARRLSEKLGVNKIVAKPSKMPGGAKILIDPPGMIRPNDTIITFPNLHRWTSGAGLAIGLAPHYSMLDVACRLWITGKATSREALIHISSRVAEIFGLERIGVLAEGARPDIIVLDFSEPPSWPLVPFEDIVYDMLLEAHHRVETAIVNGEVIVDGGEPLNVGYDKVYKAKEKITGIVVDLIKKLKG